jgi:hypothetical protein
MVLVFIIYPPDPLMSPAKIRTKLVLFYDGEIAGEWG